jgi:hypothetical protein
MCTLGERGIESIDWHCETIDRVQKKLIESAEAICKVNEAL